MMVPIQLERKTSFLKVGLKKSCCFYTSTKEIKKKTKCKKNIFHACLSILILFELAAVIEWLLDGEGTFLRRGSCVVYCSE